MTQVGKMFWPRGYGLALPPGDGGDGEYGDACDVGDDDCGDGCVDVGQCFGGV